MNPQFTYPFESSRQIGTVIEVQPSYVRINLPGAATVCGMHQYGDRLSLGEVGEFVFLDAGDRAILGRILEIRLPERDRLTVERPLEGDVRVHPVARVQMLVSLLVADPPGDEKRRLEGISSYPRLGARAFSASPKLMAWVAECAQRATSTDTVSLALGTLPAAGDLPFSITPERLLGRHAAVLGTTGGGKSWTVAKIIEELASKFPKSKVILVDPTGEYWTLPEAITMHRWVGLSPEPPCADDEHQQNGNPASEFCFPYTDLTENDLFAIFRPARGVQTPKLRAAIKSLKLARAVPTASFVSRGYIPKAGKYKKAYDDAYQSHSTVVNSPAASFDIGLLTRQILEECVWPNGRKPESPGSRNMIPDTDKWGDSNENDVSNCNSLLSRIDAYLAAPSFDCLFAGNGKKTFAQVLQEYLNDDRRRVLRLSLSSLPAFENIREILVNAIGRALLESARGGLFRQQPIVVMLDEAHQFLSRTLGEEDWIHRLDAFDIIAKEGRKYCLTAVIATQRPRDIPEGVLSQVGSLIVHRLINDADMTVVQRACGEIDRTASAFLPVLGPGEAIVVGVDVPFPITVKLTPPTAPPKSDGPDFQKHWS